VSRFDLTRPPPPVLRPFVQTLWVSEEPVRDPAISGDRERMLPTGAMHLVFRLSDQPVRLFDDVADRTGTDMGHAVVGGTRAGFYLRDTTRPVRTLGVLFRPGAAELLLGVPADELAERHTPLDDLWGRAAVAARDRLLAATSPAAQLDVVAALLAARLPAVRGMHPAVAHALGRIPFAPDVGAIVRETGYSHRRFIALFRRAVGVAPKTYQRILRFQRTLALLGTAPAPALVDVALAAGYSDQPHLNREFRAIAGISPAEYRRAAPVWAHHVPLPPGGR